MIDFLDLDGNGQQELGEPDEPWTVTGAGGGWGLRIPEAFDLDGSGFIETDEGQLGALGGTDISTGRPLDFPLLAPAGSFAITPLTTLAAGLVNDHGQDLQDALHRVSAAFGLPAQVDLGVTDPTAAALSGDPTLAAIFTAGAKVQDVVVQGARLLAGAPDGPAVADAAHVLFAALATRIAEPGSSLDLGAAVEIEGLIRGAAIRLGVPLDASLFRGATAVIAEVSRQIDAIPYTGDLAHLERVAQAQVVAQGELADELAAASAGSTPIETVIADGTGQSLGDRIAAAPTGNVVPPALFIADVRQREGDAGSTVCTFTVTLSIAPKEPVSVRYTTGDGTATTAEGDYVSTSGLLEWAPGDKTPRTIEVPISDDTDFEGDEFFHMFLSHVQGGAITWRDAAVATIVDDDPLTYSAPTDGVPNDLHLALDGNSVELTRNGEIVLLTTLSAPLPITILGADGVEDHLTIEYRGESTALVGGLSFQGGSGGPDRLTIVEGPARSLSHAIEGDRFGTLTVDGTAFSYSDVEVLDAPTASRGSLTTDEDTATEIDLRTLVSNFDTPADDLSFEVGGAENGGVELLSDGHTARFTPSENYHGTARFWFTVGDDVSTPVVTVGPMSVDIDVIPVNDPPVAVDDTAATDEDSPLVVKKADLLANDTDVETTGLDPAGSASPLSITSFTNGAHGTVIDNGDGTLTYTPEHGFSGADSFQYTVSDGDGGTAEGTVNITVNNLVDITGLVFDDLNDDGVQADGEAGLKGVVVELFDQSGASLGTTTTDAEGVYVFDVNLRAGTYRLVESQPDGLLDGDETAGNLGGSVDNRQESNAITGLVVGEPGTTADAFDYLFAEIQPSDILGLAWVDFNNDAAVDFDEKALEGVAIELTGTDDRGNTVSRSVLTDDNGVYGFFKLRPGAYSIREVQPTGYLDGQESPGTVNGDLVGSVVDDAFTDVALAGPGSSGENYNFGERPAIDGQIEAGQTAGIGFWRNKQGQALIRALNSDIENSTRLGDWLAATFPHMYGADASANDLTGKTNAEVASFYNDLFKRNKKDVAGGGPPKLDAQVLAVALATYVTNETLAGTVAADYGFTVTETGVGTRTFDVGDNGAAFGVADGSAVAVLDLLLAVDARTTAGLLYGLDGDGKADDGLERLFRTMANDVFGAINESGG